MIDLSFSISILHIPFSSGTDEQLCENRELEAFYLIFDIHMGMPVFPSLLLGVTNACALVKVVRSMDC